MDRSDDEGFNVLAGHWREIKRDVGNKGRAMLKAEPAVKSSRFLRECSCLLWLLLPYSTFQLLQLRRPESLLNSQDSFSWLFWMRAHPRFVWVILQTVSNFCCIYFVRFDTKSPSFEHPQGTKTLRWLRFYAGPAHMLSPRHHPRRAPSYSYSNSNLEGWLWGTLSTFHRMHLPLTPAAAYGQVAPHPTTERQMAGWLISTLVLWLCFSPPRKERHVPHP